MKKLFFILGILITSIIFSCNNINDKPKSEQINLMNDTLKKTHEENCKLKIDTFTFKGISIRDNIINVTKIYKVEKRQYKEKKLNKNKDPHIVEFIDNNETVIKDNILYKIKNINELTIFGNYISELIILTYKGVIYEINISVINNSNFKTENRFSKNETSVLYKKILERFNLTNDCSDCTRSNNEYMGWCSYFGRNDKITLTVKSERTSNAVYEIGNNNTPINGKNGIPNLVIKNSCNIVISDTKITKTLEHERERLQNMKEKKNSNDF